jgi:hypothetical protein
MPLGEQPYHLRSREWQAAIPPHRHQNHVRGPAVPRKRRAGVDGKVPVTGTAVVALTTTIIKSITFGSGVLARQARAHDCQCTEHHGISQTPYLHPFGISGAFYIRAFHYIELSLLVSFIITLF